MEKLEKVQPLYHKSVGYYEMTFNPITEGLELNPNFETAYETYQDIMTSLRAYRFDPTLHAYHQLYSQMSTTIESLKNTVNKFYMLLNQHIQTVI
ncbi:hypothetical protein [Lactiplantibacillus plantarum]